jgi:hypothetical protein
MEGDAEMAAVGTDMRLVLIVALMALSSCAHLGAQSAEETGCPYTGNWKLRSSPPNSKQLLATLKEHRQRSIDIGPHRTYWFEEENHQMLYCENRAATRSLIGSLPREPVGKAAWSPTES